MHIEVLRAWEQNIQIGIRIDKNYLLKIKTAKKIIHL